jgi:AbrB family looped-hinge helix DNA binding protein
MEAITVKVSNRGYIVLPAAIRKEMELKPGVRMLLTREKDSIVLKPVTSFTEKLSGLTEKTIADSPEAVTAFIDEERKARDR